MNLDLKGKRAIVKRSMAINGEAIAVGGGSPGWIRY
jgi:hypothetical protein